MKTWEMTVAGKTLKVKALKEDAKELANKIQNVLRLSHFSKEITGVLEDPDTWKEYTTMAIFGGSGVPITDPEGYEKAKNELIDSLPETVTAADFPALRGKIANIMNAHMPVKDSRKSRAEVEAAKLKAAEAREKREAEQRAQAELEAQKAAEYKKQYPYLRTHKDAPGMSNYALGAGNLKDELYRAFPTIRFSVRSESFSMGNAIRVSWTDGPTAKQVQEISDKYQQGDFDGMTDSYTYRANVFASIFGGAKYVTESREITDDLRKKAEEAGIEPRDYALIPEHAETPEEFTGDTRPSVTVKLNAEKNGVEIKFASKPGGSVIMALKGAGFRWSKFQKLWYARQSPRTIEAANRIAHIPVTEPEYNQTGDMDTAHEELTQDLIAERIGA